jgi:hypothetical protein
VAARACCPAPPSPLSLAADKRTHEELEDREVRETVEAMVNRWHDAYEQGLSHIQASQFSDAAAVFEPLLQEVRLRRFAALASLVSGTPAQLSKCAPGGGLDLSSVDESSRRKLQYLCLKHLALAEEHEGNLSQALTHTCSAADLDGSDVSLWHKVATLATRCGRLCSRDSRASMARLTWARRLRLARFGFERALRLRPRFLPTLRAMPQLLHAMDDPHGFSHACRVLHQSGYQPPGLAGTRRR